MVIFFQYQVYLFSSSKYICICGHNVNFVRIRAIIFPFILWVAKPQCLMKAHPNEQYLFLILVSSGPLLCLSFESLLSFKRITRTSGVSLKYYINVYIICFIWQEFSCLSSVKSQMLEATISIKPVEVSDCQAIGEDFCFFSSSRQKRPMEQL